MQIVSEATYETACRELTRLCHKDLHSGLSGEEKQRMDRLGDAVSRFEESEEHFYSSGSGTSSRSTTGEVRRRIPARAD